LNAATKIAIGLVAVAAMSILQVGAGAAAVKKATVHTVIIEGMNYVPATLTVAKGDIVVWINKDLFPHTVTAANGRFDSHEIKADKSWKTVAEKAGEFGYLCTFHPTMKGTLVVK
jgi:plastocyanin